jgi:hypothetical protein
MSVISIADLFKVGPPLTEAEQVGRAPSIDALSERAMAGETLRLFDQRREGKTSLALAVLARANDAHLATCATCFACQGPRVRRAVVLSGATC